MNPTDKIVVRQMEDDTEDLTTFFACESSVEPISRPAVKQCVPSTGYVKQCDTDTGCLDSLLVLICNSLTFINRIV